ncbi:MAG: TRAP transporter substrate-binding protein DctP [Burkholderiaceae bacterium]
MSSSARRSPVLGRQADDQISSPAALGDEQEVIRQTARGRIDMAGALDHRRVADRARVRAGRRPLSVRHAGRIRLRVRQAHDPAVRPDVRGRGLVPVAWSEVGNQIFFTKEAIKAPGDIRDQKIRSAPTKTDTLYVASTGATAVPLGVADTMPALKTGGVSGATWPTVYGIAVGYHKVAPYITATNHVHQVGVTFVSKKVWDSLSADRRKAISAPATRCFPALRKAIRAAPNRRS